MYKLWINVDDAGNITAASGGYDGYIVDPSEEYDYYFEVSDEVFKNLGNYQVINHELVKRTV